MSDNRTEAQKRKDQPLFRGLLRYFPDACSAVAELSRIGNEQHNKGQPMHWAFGKSMDHGDCLMRHQLDHDTEDTDGVYHDVKVAWRALAQLQTRLESMDINLHQRRQAQRDRQALGDFVPCKASERDPATGTTREPTPGGGQDLREMVEVLTDFKRPTDRAALAFVPNPLLARAVSFSRNGESPVGSALHVQGGLWLCFDPEWRAPAGYNVLPEGAIGTVELPIAAGGPHFFVPAQPMEGPGK